MRPRYDTQFVLAFYPTTQGYAFVLFEAPETPFDWGVSEIRKGDKNAGTMKALAKLFANYHPDVLVIEDGSDPASRRAERIRRLYKRIEHYAATQATEVRRCTRADIERVFEPTGATTKYEIAEVIATTIPAFAHRLPRKRKIWMSEDPRQGLFDAAAIGIAFYSQAGRATPNG